jgi:hypothetical protein
MLNSVIQHVGKQQLGHAQTMYKLAHVQVTFKLFGVLPGAVGLRGTVVPVEAGQPHGRGTAGEGDTVRVLFEPPVLSLGSGLHFRIGALQLHMQGLSATAIVHCQIAVT